VRIFDLNRPDADADFLLDNSNSTFSHDGTIKSVVWAGEHTGVTAAEDGKIKCVNPSHKAMRRNN
jgi:hypothetical protein